MRYIYLMLSTLFLFVGNLHAQSDLECGQIFSYTGSSQSVTVPAGLGTIIITAVGADGGDRGNGGSVKKGGSGATVTTVFSVTPGDVLNIVVGEAGASESKEGGGGGASGVYNATTSALLVVAGGGGGAGNSEGGKGASASAGPGTGGLATGDSAGGGGGITSAGGNCNAGSCTGGGRGTSTGSSGGNFGGGFGYGGGGGITVGDRTGGGGGGYTGGNAGVSSNAGGDGGGSYSLLSGTITAGTDAAGAKSNGSVQIACSALPVEIFSFTIQNKNNHVLLDWKTRSEVNLEGYQIERSRDAINWEVIGYESTKLESGDGNIYQFTDTAPHYGMNFYRLNLMDLDGASRYTSNLNIKILYEARNIQVAPNPATTTFRVYINESVLEGETQMAIFGRDGAVIRNYTSINGSGDIYIQDLIPGVYFLKFIYEGQSYTKRFIKY